MGALQQGLAAAWSAVATFVPKLVVFLIILLIGWLIAKAVSKAVQMAFSKLGFNKLLTKSGLHDMTSGSGIDVGDILVKLIYYFILLIFLQLALSAFGPNAVKDLIDQVVLFLPRIVVAVVLVLVAAAIGRAVSDLITSSLGNRPAGPTLGKIAFGFILALGIISALNQIGIAVTVTTPVLIAVLASAAGVIVVGVGGGLIQPMQQRWTRWLNNAESQFAAKGGGESQPGGGTQGHSGTL
ncbi:hypothetical protein EIL87_03785 [Saccharopolyspora rhizosphaerae]|uniref:Mechanosensitive ion channel n=1 Tax=Saccharopolyspora rhizosphaerae TaxID=2492662 RepID=A0A3R8Q5Y3_9PSEU|nr:hypothetical protein [Saccharopolyspora rhizosphaerae]RRO19245.1 hypothetical protein EIL87_03785 [Saccharopolyspora rhizosphaerae]